MENYVSIRMAEEKDAEALLRVYAPYVEETPITFEYKVPTVSEFAGRIREITKDFPYLVCEIDGEVAGYAYAAHYRNRAAYDWDCELSVYLAEDYHRAGIGTLLYEVLLELLSEMNYVHAYACITTEGKTSIRFHEAMGFTQTAFFSNCGYKSGRWYDVVWMDQILNDAKGPVLPVKRAAELAQETVGKLLSDCQKELETKLQNDIMICKNFLGLFDL